MSVDYAYLHNDALCRTKYVIGDDLSCFQVLYSSNNEKRNQNQYCIKLPAGSMLITNGIGIGYTGHSTTPHRLFL